MSEECESEKESIRDQLITSCDREKDDLRTELRNNLKLFSKKAISDGTKRCEIEKAEFKQDFLGKYEKDIQ